MRALVAAVFATLLLASSAAWAECAYHNAKAQETVAQSGDQDAQLKRLPPQGG